MYCYDGVYPSDDDFLEIAKTMQRVENIGFATPVYWYSMSASLKNFFDRLSDLLSTHKSIGRSLKGKKTFLISTGSDPALPPGFEEPFRLTSEYFEMVYQQTYYKSVK
jgi:multimeric flavodoxin WrbA